MDESVNPCDDFYEFACGSFKRHQSIPPGMRQVTSFTLQANNNEILLRSLLETPLSSNSSRLRNNTVNLYQSCMNQSAREVIGVKPMLRVLHTLGPWRAMPQDAPQRQFNLIERLQAISLFLFVYTESVPFYSIDVQIDSFNSSRNTLYIGQPSTIINREDHAKNNSKNVVALTTAISDIARLFNFSLNDSDVQDVVEVDRELALIQLPMSERRDSTKTKNATVQFLNEKFNCGKLLNWTEILQAFLQNVSYSVSNSTPLNMRDVEYFGRLCGFLTNANANAEKARLVENYLLIRSVWPFLTHLNGAAFGIVKRLSQVVDGVHGSLNPWSRCVMSVSEMFGFPLGKLFVDEHFQSESKGFVDTLINNVKAAFNVSLREADWMDAKTRQLATEKLGSIRNLVGFPDYFNNASAMAEEWDAFDLRPDAYFENLRGIEQLSYARLVRKITQPVKLDFAMTPQSINAYYSPSSNVIAFPAGILQRPFYQSEFPLYVSYGAIGSVVGHEITHGFDDNGRHFDKDGNQRQWWTSKTASSFREAADCISKQYETFVVDGDVRVTGELVLGESIADNGGLKNAFRAYKALNLRDELLLPNLGQRYSKEQLLFVAYSQTWCELETSEALRQSVTIDPHPPGRMRVWGPIINNKDFGRVFKCPKGSRMNPEKKCTVW